MIYSRIKKKMEGKWQGQIRQETIIRNDHSKKRGVYSNAKQIKRIQLEALDKKGANHSSKEIQMLILNGKITGKYSKSEFTIVISQKFKDPWSKFVSIFELTMWIWPFTLFG